MYALTSRYPALKSALPHLQLTELPTPISRADALGRQIGLNSLTVKCDDQSASLYGGNKVRKLEYLLADAMAQECDAVATFGAVGSNHALATSIYAAQLGLICYAILTDQPMTPNIGKTLRYHAKLGTQIVHTVGYKETLQAYEKICAGHPTGSDKVYKIPWGGSSWLGAVGFIAAAMELADQLPTGEAPDVIYCACGTMGTAVGLALGLRLARLPTTLQAIQVTPIPVLTGEGFRKLFATTNQELHARDSALPLLDDPFQNLEIRDEFLGPGYAQVTPAASEAVELMADEEHIKLEITYTGKALAALISDARQGRLAGKKVMFWNTYNSQPYPEDLAEISVDGLPESLRKYLA